MCQLKQINIIVFLILLTLKGSNSFELIYRNVSYKTPYNDAINITNEITFQFFGIEEPLPARVSISSTNANASDPLMIVARQARNLLSWQLPLLIESETGTLNFTLSERTLCRDVYQPLLKQEKEIDTPFVTLATTSMNNISFSIRVDYEEQFVIKADRLYNATISPSRQRYFFYNFTANNNLKNLGVDSNYDTVILEVTSNDLICMIVSIQNVTCPVFDTNEDVTFRGFYETVNTKGGITIPKYKFPFGFFVVFVAQPDDAACLGYSGRINPTDLKRNKNIQFIIKPSITYNDYINAVIITFGCIAGFYLIFCCGFFFCSKHGFVPRQMEYVTEAEAVVVVPRTPSVESDNLSLESDYDTMSEIMTTREIRYGKAILYLSDLARKDPKVHKYKSYLYLYNVLTIALFYGLPVVQLVITYQSMLNKTGEQDLCYYNFLCAHPFGFISDFNHLLSNVGYVTLGFLFLCIIYRREITHKDPMFERQYGIPQHYGMFYAMGVALIMEGVLSGSYHICPNIANFQFDSSFMYVMAVLCMVKLYQNRHPDINAAAVATFGLLAVTILLELIGILDGELYFWIIFTFIYLTICFYLTLQVYYMGCWKIDRGLVYRLYNNLRYDFLSGFINILKPLHTARMVLLVIGNLCNWALAFWGVYRHEKDFALFLLAVFMMNTLLYFFFYICMKIINREKVNKLSWFFLCLSVACAISAMWFFLHKSISWSKSPAESRTYNQECKLLKFYDFHDIWHFLSAIGMFFTFMVLLTLDDDLSHKHRSQIIVF